MDEWYKPRTADQITPYPWLHPYAVEYLEGILQPEWNVLEHGAGGSTLWFADRVARIVSVEHDLEWREKVRELAPANVTLLLSPISDVPAVGTFDLFFIDGVWTERGVCLTKAQDYLKPGGWIVLDNANRPEYSDQRKKLREWAKLKARFDNNVPWSKYFVTEFWRCE